MPEQDDDLLKWAEEFAKRGKPAAAPQSPGTAVMEPPAPDDDLLKWAEAFSKDPASAAQYARPETFGPPAGKIKPVPTALMSMLIDVGAKNPDEVENVAQAHGVHRHPDVMKLIRSAKVGESPWQTEQRETFGGSNIVFRTIGAAAVGVMNRVSSLAARGFDIAAGTDYAGDLLRAQNEYERAVSNAGQEHWATRNVRGVLQSIGQTMVFGAAGRGLATFGGVFEKVGRFSPYIGFGLSGANEAYTTAHDAGLRGKNLAMNTIGHGLAESAYSMIFLGLSKLHPRLQWLAGNEERLAGMQGVKALLSEGFVEGMKTLGLETTSEVMEELTTEGTNLLIDKLTGLNPDAFSAESIKQTAFDTTVQTVIATVLGGGTSELKRRSDLNAVADEVLRKLKIEPTRENKKMLIGVWQRQKDLDAARTDDPVQTEAAKAAATKHFAEAAARSKLYDAGKEAQESLDAFLANPGEETAKAMPKEWRAAAAQLGFDFKTPDGIQAIRDFYGQIKAAEGKPGGKEPSSQPGQLSDEALADWATKNPDAAKKLAGIESPSRKDWEATGLPRMDAAERKAVAARIAALAPQQDAAQEPQPAPTDEVEGQGIQLHP